MATETETRPTQPWHAMGPDEALAALEVEDGQGLTQDEAARRLDQHGPNQLKQEAETPAWVHLLNQFRSPLILILVVAAVVTALLGELVDTGVIVVVLLLNAIIGFTQERKAERSVRALAELAAPHAIVLRDGDEHEIDASDVVPGDVLLLEMGAQIPADARVLDAQRLGVDESLLTGESEPVRKTPQAVDADAVPADRTDMVYMGSNVSRGGGRALVVETGTSTELGGIAAQVREQEGGDTPLQERMSAFANVIALAVLGSALVAVLIGLALGRDLGEMFLVAVALAVAVVPEGLPVVLTVALALGVRRMAGRNALIRKLPAVETLGSTTVIGSDKTGTLTRNEMTVLEAWTPDGTRWNITGEAEDGEAVPDDLAETPEATLHRALLAGALTNEARFVDGDDGPAAEGEPTEAALMVAASVGGLDVRAARGAQEVLANQPFESANRYSATVRDADGTPRLYVKGAPEAILERCTDAAGGPLQVAAIEEVAEAMAGRGLRVLAVAARDLDTAPDPDDEPDASALTFLGLQGIIDPPRPGVKESIARCHAAGVRVIMITGDHAGTALAIAEQLGIAEADDPVLTGREVEQLSDEELAERVEDTPVFARVSPTHKLRIVQALQGNGHTTAVTGDGVNDAPALKAADIGVAMGRDGTDVAREAADMVLTDDDFSSIQAAVEEGRVTFDNVRKVTFFLVSTGAAAIVAIITSLFLGVPLPYVPAQLLWLNLVTNGLQDLALAFEPAEPDVLDRTPRDRNEGIVNRVLWERAGLTGTVMAAGSLGLFVWALESGLDLVPARTIALTTLVVAMGFHVFNARSERRSVLVVNPLTNRFLLAAQIGAIAVHVGALYLPFTQFVLRVEPFDLLWWPRIVAAAVVVVAVSELHKLVRSR